ncbi:MULTISPECIES: phosphoethanolamine transferase CptA [unclassified Gilliamella]|uniref:phosphoethanolamine transferase CptA n=1 Tax=unclassified Gilliamella TaxID=2685620 RepID=UPI00130C31BF|nr:MULTISPECIES: phosphoethanolamine transferase CptA [unclassified Gilliamella]MWP49890.1 phosphoethanolamine transferase CptA [Gilliamella sp. Lep-s35]MWP68526.1 phosphoethanolamine transferase CptA [Gilliamella sp. Lep-s5]MWP77939.1 phosphoethanolamine transferase CptA [Gilliamella sp. Lep-s21]
MENTKINRSFSWSALIFDILFFTYFSSALQLYIFFSGHSNVIGLRDSIIYSLIWLIPILIFPNYTRKIATVFGIIVGSLSLIPVGYFTIYRQEFSQSVFFIMAESNFTESSEFIQQYLSFKLVAVLIIYSLIGIYLWTKVKPVYVKNRTKSIASLLIVIYAVMPVFISVTIKKSSIGKAGSHLLTRMETTVPWQLLNSYLAYRTQLSNMEDILNHLQTLPPLENLKDTNGNTPRTLVLVIGESTTRNRMGIYGYERDTTPQIEQFKKDNPDFVVFNDVVSSRPYTIEILQQALTFADEKHPDLYLKTPSLMHLMKQAGYKTFWITNQQTMTRRNTMLTMFSQQTDEQFYMNNDRNQSARRYDESVFDPFKKVLTDPSEKKFIVIHLLGTHMKYEFRYPKGGEHDRFKDKAGISFNIDNDKVGIYNTYDNAVSYNDYVTTTLFNIFKNSQQNGFMLYFSDHGEDVYQTPPHNILGRNEKAPTRTMYTIPFMLWQSPTWIKTHPNNYQNYVDRKFSTQDLIHTWSDLAGLSYNLYVPEKSVVNPNFHESIRWIGDPYDKNGLIDFDKLPK